MSAATVTVRVIGAGRAGRSFAKAIDDLVEWDVIDIRGRGVAIDDAAADVDLVMIATPDAVVADVAAAIRPGRAVVAHVAGSLGLDVLAPHDRRAALHPLMSLPDAEIGAERLTGGWFAVAGDPLVADLATALGGRTFEIADDDRERAQGLMYRRSLAADRGMLFDFKTERSVSFWMRNTYIPLDMIFIRADGRIRSIARNTTPMSDQGVPSGGPVRAVLEIPGGRAAELGVLPGDRVVHRIFPRG